jgi:hypothetical protein
MALGLTQGRNRRRITCNMNLVLDTNVSATGVRRLVLRDPDDEMVLETAVNGNAGAVVTFNIKHFEGARRFGADLLFPAEALGRM